MNRRSSLEPAPRGPNPADCRLTVPAAVAGQSLAVVLSRECLLEPAAARDLIDFGSVHLDGRRHRDPDTPLGAGQTVQVFWPWDGVRRYYSIDPGRIIYRDRTLLAYNKEAGIPSQQTPSDGYNNVYEGLKRLLRADRAAARYVALHHRLDLGTSGVLLFSLDRRANRQLGAAFQEHRVHKDYLAWVEGCPAAAHGLLDWDIGRDRGAYRAGPPGTGKPAQTEYWVLLEGIAASLIWARPRTGRTHQIRLHLAALGHPVVGDQRYGSHLPGRLMLHAYRLRLTHPISGAALTFTAPLPLDWAQPLRA